MVNYSKAISLRIDKTLGYVYFLDYEHPLATSAGKVYYHRHVVSLSIGRWLLSTELVHHKDHDKLNNCITNLEILTKAEHARTHRPKTMVQHPCQRCSTLTYNKNYCSVECSSLSSRKVVRPSKQQLKLDIKELPYTKIGKKYGVSDNAVRKWAKQYKLLT